MHRAGCSMHGRVTEDGGKGAKLAAAISIVAVVPGPSDTVGMATAVVSGVPVVTGTPASGEAGKAEAGLEVIGDVKQAVTCCPRLFFRPAANAGYHQQLREYPAQFRAFPELQHTPRTISYTSYELSYNVCILNIIFCLFIITQLVL